jgi:hypothetical protein
MALAGNKFNLFVEDILKANCNFSTPDVIKVMWSTVAPVATNHVYGDLTDLSTSNGYTAGGATCGSNTVSNASGTESLAATATTWTSSTGDVTVRYFTYYDNTPSTKTLIVWYDYGSSLTLHGANGDTLQLSPAGNVLLTLA